MEEDRRAAEDAKIRRLTAVRAETSPPGGAVCSNTDMQDAERSADLAARIRAGDPAAWEALYARYRDVLLFSIRCRLGSRLRARLDSEDVLQSVVKDAVSDLRRFEPRADGALGRYLHVCVLNKIRSKADHFDAEKRRGEVPLTESVEGRLSAPPETVGYRDAARFEPLERALALLPESQREVVLLRRIEGLSNAEAAAAIGRSEEATSKLHARALRALGNLLQAQKGRPGSRP